MTTLTVNPLDWRHINEMTEEDKIKHISWYNPEAFYKLHMENLTEKVCEAATDAGISLAKIPEEFRTIQVCWNAIRRNPYQICIVPESMLSEGMILTALYDMTSPGSSMIWNQLPTHLITQRMIDFLWKRGELSQLTQKKLLNNDYIIKMCLKYVGTLLSSIRQPTVKDCWTSCKQTGRALEYVPASLQTPSLCVYALGRGGSLKHVKIPLENLQKYMMRVTGAPERVFDCMSVVLEML